jgi:quercetin dioxygenase-like cupin family protein
MRRDAMGHQHIDFRSQPWESPAPGIRFKAFVAGGKKMRLLEFAAELFEKDWCLKGHLGYLLEGRMTIEYGGEVVEYRAGDGLFIPEGDKHKARIAPGERALLILFEKP